MASWPRRYRCTRSRACPKAVSGAGSATRFCSGSRSSSAVPEPLPTCYLNGSLMPLRDARVSALDRSFLFGDGVYEVIAARAVQARRLAANLARLSHSLRQLRIRNPLSDQQWTAIVQQLINAN